MSIRDIEQNVAKGKFEKALNAFSVLVENVDEDSYTEMIGFKNRLTSLNYDIRTNVINQELATQQRSKLVYDFLKLLKVFKKNQQTRNKKKPTLATHHIYTCDRIDQAETFKLYNEQKPEDKRLHFFYFHGGNLQAHEGLFQKFVIRLEGKDQDFRPNYVAPDYKVESFNIKFPKDKKETALKIELPRLILKALGVKFDESEKMGDKCLSYGLENSTLKLIAEDKVCIHISIPEVRWDKDLTPKMARWLIEEFCLKNIPKDTPEFFIFYSVEYDEEKSNIKDEIESAMQMAEYTLEVPELGMVRDTDIEEWFTDYESLWKRKSAFIRTKNKWMEETDEEMYMLDVQELLEDIINEINYDEKKQSRNSK